MDCSVRGRDLVGKSSALNCVNNLFVSFYFPSIFLFVIDDDDMIYQFCFRHHRQCYDIEL